MTGNGINKSELKTHGFWTETAKKTILAERQSNVEQLSYQVLFCFIGNSAQTREQTLEPVRKRWYPHDYSNFKLNRKKYLPSGSQMSLWPSYYSQQNVVPLRKTACSERKPSGKPMSIDHLRHYSWANKVHLSMCLRFTLASIQRGMDNGINYPCAQVRRESHSWQVCMSVIDEDRFRYLLNFAQTERGQYSEISANANVVIRQHARVYVWWGNWLAEGFQLSWPPGDIWTV